MGEKLSLVRERYFVSKIFKDKKSLKWTDGNDTFSEELIESGLRIISQGSSYDALRQWRCFRGINETCCHIQDITTHYTMQSTFNKYRRIIKISSSPCSAFIPIELTNALEKRGYKEREKNSRTLTGNHGIKTHRKRLSEFFE